MNINLFTSVPEVVVDLFPLVNPFNVQSRSANIVCQRERSMKSIFFFTWIIMMKVKVTNLLMILTVSRKWSKCVGLLHHGEDLGRRHQLRHAKSHCQLNLPH